MAALEREGKGDLRRVIVRISFLFHFERLPRRLQTGGGCTPLYELNGDVRPARVCFSGFFVLNRVSILSFLVLIRVSILSIFVLNRINVLNRVSKIGILS